MHYIPGVTITISDRSVGRIQPGMTSSQIRDMKSSRGTLFKKQREQLKHNLPYTLVRVHKNEHNKVCYVFTAPGESRITLEFDNLSQGDRFISEIKGETIPNYSNSIIDRTD